MFIYLQKLRKVISFSTEVVSVKPYMNCYLSPVLFMKQGLIKVLSKISVKRDNTQNTISQYLKQHESQNQCRPTLDVSSFIPSNSPSIMLIHLLSKDFITKTKKFY